MFPKASTSSPMSHAGKAPERPIFVKLRALASRVQNDCGFGPAIFSAPAHQRPHAEGGPGRPADVQPHGDRAVLRLGLMLRRCLSYKAGEQQPEHDTKSERRMKSESLRPGQPAPSADAPWPPRLRALRDELASSGPPRVSSCVLSGQLGPRMLATASSPLRCQFEIPYFCETPSTRHPPPDTPSTRQALQHLAQAVLPRPSKGQRQAQREEAAESVAGAPQETCADGALRFHVRAVVLAGVQVAEAPATSAHVLRRDQAIAPWFACVSGKSGALWRCGIPRPE